MGRSLWSAILWGLRKIVPDWETLGLCWGSISVGAVSLPSIPPSTDATDLSGPPSGHPERVDPSAPLSEVERALWSQLT
jgi:hypothetical protein